MENNSGSGYSTVLAEARDRAGLDEELYCFALYDSMISFDLSGPARIDATVGLMMRMGERVRRHGAAAEKENLRAVAIRTLYEELANRGLPVHETANRLARESFGVDSVLWLRSYQVAQLVWKVVKVVKEGCP